MEYSRAASTIAKVVLLVSLSAPSFASEGSLWIGGTIIHDTGYRRVYQNTTLTSFGFSGGYPLTHGISIMGWFGYAPSRTEMGEVSAGLDIVNLDVGIIYRPPVGFFLRPYVSVKAGALYGSSFFSDGYTLITEDAFGWKGEAVAGGEVFIWKREWGGFTAFFEWGWQQASPLNFTNSGGIDISGISYRLGAAVIF